jgi:hypothetical protein
MSKRPPDWIGWRLFGPRLPDSTQQCLTCAKALTYNNTTANFKKHLEKKHKALWDELQREEAPLAKKARVFHILAPDQPSLGDFFDPIKAAERSEANKRLVALLEKDTVRFICADLRPYSAVEGPFGSHVLPAFSGFHESIAPLRPHFHIFLGDGYKSVMQRGRPLLPQRLFDRHHAKLLVETAARQIDDMNKKLYMQLAAGYASWTTDIWTGLGQKEMCGLTAHFIPPDWSTGPQRVTLDLFYFPESHTGENLCAKLRERANLVGLPYRMTTDSGANVLLAARLFLGREGPPSLTFSPSLIPRREAIKCIDHLLDKMLKTAFKIPAVEALFERQQTTIKFFRKSNKANTRLFQAQVELHAATPNPFDAFHAIVGIGVRCFLSSTSLPALSLIFCSRLLTSR